MRLFAIGTLVALAIFVSTATSTLAAPAKATAGPYQGKYQGTVTSKNGTSAPMTVTLTHKGNIVSGVATIGQGLKVDTAYCGSANVPSRSERLSGKTQPGKPRHLEATSKFTVEGVPVTVRFKSDVSADGKTVKGTTTLDVPFFCGSDPVLSGTLHKVP